MNKLTKGEQTKKEILERANAFFNCNGVDHTIVHISNAIGMNKSRITNYFPKKEDLVLKLLENYEQNLVAVFSKHRYYKAMSDFGAFIPLLSDSMELMFQFRGVISYALINPTVDNSIYKHLKENYSKNKERIRKRLEDFATNGLVKRKVLEPETFEEYCFQYMCMSSNWIITHNLLDSDKDFHTLKPRYLRSILCCLGPHLTRKGKENLEKALLAL